MNSIKKIVVLLLLLCFGGGIGFAQSGLSIEAASHDVTLAVRGKQKVIDKVNPSRLDNLDNCIVLLSSQFGKMTGIQQVNCVAVQVDNQMRVRKVVNPSLNGALPSFNESSDISIPEKGFVLIATDTDYKTKGYKRFLAENFKEGDLVKIRFNDEIITPYEAENLDSKISNARIEFDTEQMFTSSRGEEIISGVLVLPKRHAKYTVSLMKENNTILSVIPKAGGKFSIKVKLLPGINYLEVILEENKKIAGIDHFTIYCKKPNKQQSEVVMWVEQFPNVRTLLNEDSIRSMMLKCKEAGVTAFGLDVKGPEGYVSYKKNTLSHSPYFTATVNPKKKVGKTNMDLLESFVSIAHELEMKVYASFNFFTEGNVTTDDYAILKDHPEWEEIVQRPEDKGKLMKISESTAGQEARAGKKIILGFVNPANPEVQDFQLLRVKEVLQNYDIDGVVMDRCRYDNLYADFSETSRQKFSEYLQREGKTLNQFPNDAFFIDEKGEMIKGQYFVEWITFRSQVIKEFTDRVRLLVDEYKQKKNPNLKLAAYVGSWFQSYWQNGVNWSSKNFRYDERLSFPESQLYTEKYYQTSYTGNIDFLMIGTYYKTVREINQYITLGNILTNGEIPLYGSMSIPDLKNEEQTEVFKTSLSGSSGLMLFDLCYIDWNLFPHNLKKALKHLTTKQIK